VHLVGFTIEIDLILFSQLSEARPSDPFRFRIILK
jgi:hypothetical protein